MRGFTLLAHSSWILPLQAHPVPYSLEGSKSAVSFLGCSSGVAGAGPASPPSPLGGGLSSFGAGALAAAPFLAMTLALSLSRRSLALAALHLATALSSSSPSIGSPPVPMSLPAPMATLAQSPRNSSASRRPPNTARISFPGNTMA